MKAFSWKGCMIGCLGAIVLFFIVIGVTLFSLTRNKDFNAEPSILAEDSEFYARIYLTEDNPVLVDFVTNLALSMNKNSPISNMLPDAFAKHVESDARSDIYELLPLEIEGAGQLSHELFNVSLGFSSNVGLVNVAYWFLKRAHAKKGDVQTIDGIEYVILRPGSDEVYLTLDDNLGYLSNKPEHLNKMVNTTQGVSPEDPRLKGIDLGKPIHGFIMESTGANSWKDYIAEDSFLRVALEPEAQEQEHFIYQTSKLAFEASFSDQDTVSGKLIFDTTSPHAEEQLRRVMTEYKEKDVLKISYELEPKEGSYVLVFHITGFSNLKNPANLNFNYNK